ncbi:hypothetical protein FA95DRAFT_1578334, partial [Auriscalpium vulgare]
LPTRLRSYASYQVPRPTVPIPYPSSPSPLQTLARFVLSRGRAGSATPVGRLGALRVPSAAKRDEDVDEVLSAIEDIDWVLSQLVDRLPRGTKRGADEASNGPDAKRAKI